MAKAAPIIIIVAGILGVVACFLPYVDSGRSLWSFHDAKGGAYQGLLDGPQQVYVVLAMFGLTAVMGVLGAGRLKLMHAASALAFCILALLCTAVRKGFSSWHGHSLAFGAKLMLVAAIAGIAGALLGALKATRTT
jgi:hypothetical protein